MTVRVVTAPSAEPVTLAQAKLHLVVADDFTADDALITALIRVARQYAENYTHRVFCQRALELLLPGFPVGSIIKIPYPPLQSIGYVRYTDFDGVQQTVDAADYQVDIYSAPGLLKPAYLKVWPAITRADFNVVQIGYTAGYTPTGSPISDIDYAGDPALEALKQWIKIRIGTMYVYREEIITGMRVADIQSDYIDGLLEEYMVEVF